MFFKQLEELIEKNDSLVCVGLDPRPGRLNGDSLTIWAGKVVDATAKYACVYKPNHAFFEQWGTYGLGSLEEVIGYIHRQGMPVILDAKRGDIGSTAKAYARAGFEVWGADAVTVNPYLGSDALRPFFEYQDKGVIVLCHTSNPSAEEVQHIRMADDRPLYEHIADLSLIWNKRYGNVGLVVAATFTEELAAIRAKAPDLWFLVPGVGAQGGDLEAALRAGLNTDGHGLVINSSRGIIFADNPGEAARKLRDRINAVRCNLQGE